MKKFYGVEERRAYYFSDTWREKTALLKEKCDNKCEICHGVGLELMLGAFVHEEESIKRKSILNIHHLSYCRFMQEADEDLIVVCIGCHGILEGFKQTTANPSKLWSTPDVMGRWKTMLKERFVDCMVCEDRIGLETFFSIFLKDEINYQHGEAHIIKFYY
jgi:hypothetical protein